MATRPKWVDKAAEVFVKREKEDPDLALLVNLSKAPEFGPLVEHFRKVRNKAMVSEKAAFQEGNSLKAAYHSGVHQAQIDTVLWLLQYSGKGLNE